MITCICDCFIIFTVNIRTGPRGEIRGRESFPMGKVRVFGFFFEIFLAQGFTWKFYIIPRGISYNLLKLSFINRYFYFKFLITRVKKKRKFFKRFKRLQKRDASAKKPFFRLRKRTCLKWQKNCLKRCKKNAFSFNFLHN